MGSSMLNYTGRWAEVAQLWEEPELAADSGMPNENGRQFRVAELHSVLRLTRYATHTAPPNNSNINFLIPMRRAKSSNTTAFPLDG